jgi:hypothetical protein
MESVLRGERDGFGEGDLQELEAYDCSPSYAQNILDVALAAVAALVDRFDIAELWLEERVWPLPDRNDLWGTSDIIGRSRDGKILLVGDLKTGRIKVDVPYNDQALLYGMGARRMFDNPPEHIAISIIQPSASKAGFSVWETKSTTMDEFARFLSARLDAIDSPEPNPTPNEGCVYCPAKAICPAL